MSYVLALPGVGKAIRCEAASLHTPQPVRYVWHHVLPQEAGGQTTAENLVQLCDNDHYGVHAILYQMAKNNGQLTTLKRFTGTKRAQLAQLGYEAALAAGTLGKIPNEGGG